MNANKKINWQSQTILPSNSGSIPLNARAVLFKNKGLGIVFVQGYPLEEGEALNLDCQDSEIDTTAYKIAFENSTDGKLLVMRKIYVS